MFSVGICLSEVYLLAAGIHVQCGNLSLRSTFWLQADMFSVGICLSEVYLLAAGRHVQCGNLSL